MRIVVCVRQIIDPTTIRVSRSRQAIDKRRAKMILNPSDRRALDVAYQLKQEGVAEEIVALSAGDAQVEDVLREALSRGADQAILATGSDLETVGEALSAAVLAAAIDRLDDVALVLVGSSRPDTERSELAPRLAMALGNWPILMNAERLQVSRHEIGGLQVFDDTFFGSSYPLPAVVAIKEDLQQSRYAKSADIIDAYRRHQVSVWDTSELGLNLDDYPTLTPDRELRVPDEREYGIILEGTPAEVTTTLFANLKARRVI
ncbi:MAG: hypothetical protein U9R25_15400 [Chloroflexota bacterium]|nr:hypothetical protein [Chloroflexota bacterium]